MRKEFIIKLGDLRVAVNHIGIAYNHMIELESEIIHLKIHGDDYTHDKNSQSYLSNRIELYCFYRKIFNLEILNLENKYFVQFKGILNTLVKYSLMPDDFIIHHYI